MQLQTGIHTAQIKPQTRALSIGIVIGLHVVALYAILTGVTGTVIHVQPPGTYIPIPPDKTHIPPPPPPSGPLVNPTTTDVPVPIWNTIPDSDHTITEPRNDRSQQTQGNPSTSAQPLVATHTIPPYPSMSQRLGEQGTVTLRIAIAADGSVSDASIQASSGSERLDAAAIAWVKSHWRYKPATRDGTAIASTTLAAVKFDLKTAR